VVIAAVSTIVYGKMIRSAGWEVGRLFIKFTRRTAHMENCENCLKYYNQVIFKECSFCENCSFHENILCDLLRSSQNNSNDIDCHAFKPNLSVVGEPKNIYKDIQNSDKEKGSSDHQKWLKAYARQQLKHEPEKVFSNLNYHACFITKNRQKLFHDISDKIMKVSDAFSELKSRLSSNLNLLFVSSDHIHIYIKSSPDYSAYEVADEALKLLDVFIRSEFPIFSEKKQFFENSYFIETVG